MSFTYLVLNLMQPAVESWKYSVSERLIIGGIAKEDWGQGLEFEGAIELVFEMSTEAVVSGKCDCKW